MDRCLFSSFDTGRRVGGIPDGLELAADRTQSNLAGVQTDAGRQLLRGRMARVEAIDGVTDFDGRQAGVQTTLLLGVVLAASPTCYHSGEPGPLRGLPHAQCAVPASTPDEAAPGLDEPAEHLVILVQELVQLVGRQVFGSVV